ncbi:MAG TPA: hypothetical protein VJB37_00420 [Patescibacteria group bacterium]|nr:hypothetical protein [Patescibacteria group bacterium]
MFLESLLPQLPTSYLELSLIVIGLLGGILLTYAVFLETEKRQDVVFMIGALCLLVYALYRNNLIFIIAMSGLFLASLIEFGEIIFHLHHDQRSEIKALFKKR